MSAFKGVWVFSENLDLTMEMLSKGRELANKLQTELAAIVIGYNVKEQAEELAKYGTDRVYVVDSPNCRNLQTEPYLSALMHLASKQPPEIILIGSTRRGRELAARLATTPKVGLVHDVFRLDINDDGKITAARVVYGGSGIALTTYQIKPQIATVPPRTFDKPKPSEKKAEIVYESLELEEPKTEVVEIRTAETAKARIEEASVVICGGRGVAKKDDFKMLEELANIL
ncbi:MAG: electron transfer flavoprotein subunit alpha/FixB family protein, partial [Candidatus Bathyarchaeia archaeon]